MKFPFILKKCGLYFMSARFNREPEEWKKEGKKK
jgi:hypothetical protein